MQRHILYLIIIFFTWHICYTNEKPSFFKTTSQGIDIQATPQLHQFDGSNLLWVTNDQTPYALSILSNFAIYQGTPKKIQLNNVDEADNPIHNKTITFVHSGLDGKYIICMTEEDPYTVYLLQNYHYENPFLTTASDVLKEYNNLTSTIPLCAEMGIVSLSKQEDNKTVSFTAPHIFLAFQEKSGVAIVTLRLEDQIVEDENEKQHVEYTLKPSSLNSENTCIISYDKLAHALHLPSNVSPDTIKITNLYWDQALHCLYCSFSIEDASLSSANIINVCAIHIENNTARCIPIAPFAHELSHQDDTQNEAYASIPNLKTLHSSLGPIYLIFVGNKKSDQEILQEIRCMPLVSAYPKKTDSSKEGKPVFGTLANYDSIPREFFQESTKLFETRAFIIPMEDINFYSSKNLASMVGNTRLPGLITDMRIVGDAIYVSIGDTNTNDILPGVFHSQPIFDNYGKIIAWTPWRRVGGIYSAVYGMGYIKSKGIFWLYEKSDTANHYRYRRTAWSTQEENTNNEKITAHSIIQTLETEFAKNTSGIQGLTSHTLKTRSDNTSSSSSLLLATGYQKVVLLETGCGKKDNPSPHTDNFPMFIFDNDKTLTKMGPITCAAIIADTEQAWICVGGPHGIAILAHQDGSGISLENFSLKSCSSMEFYPVGTYKFVKKIIAHKDQLFILSSRTCEKINLSSEWCHISYNTVLKQPILLNKDISSNSFIGFTDMLIFNDKILIGTTAGLFCGKKINSTEIIDWQEVTLPETHRNITTLYCVLCNESQPNMHAQLYVVTQSAEKTTHVYRFYVSSDAIRILPDKRYENIPCSFVYFGGTRTGMYVDGTHIHTFNPQNENSMVHVIDYETKGKIMRNPRHKIIPLNTPGPSYVRHMVYNDALGTMLISGDFGIRMHK